VAPVRMGCPHLGLIAIEINPPDAPGKMAPLTLVVEAGSVDEVA
jgi:hypothetical protein